MLAARGGHEAAVRALLAAGARHDANNNVRASTGARGVRGVGGGGAGLGGEGGRGEGCACAAFVCAFVWCGVFLVFVCSPAGGGRRLRCSAHVRDRDGFISWAEL